MSRQPRHTTFNDLIARHRACLEELAFGGKATAEASLRARALLLLAEGATYPAVACELAVSPSSLVKIRTRFLLLGVHGLTDAEAMSNSRSSRLRT